MDEGLEDISLDEELLEDSELDLESQIEDAVTNLSEEDLESEVDEELLMDMVASDINSLDALTSRDLKIAFGEEVEDRLEESTEEISNDSDDNEFSQESSEKVDGVEALKSLLTALNDKNVAASMKGMKISINITLGDA